MCSRRGNSAPRACAARIAVVTVVAIIHSCLFIGYEQHLIADRPMEMTSLRFGNTRPPIQGRMYMGVHVAPVPCPNGMYRKPNSGGSLGECEKCPRGVYGSTPGLTSSACTAKCPKGTYNDQLGAKSILACKKCPAGVYGSTAGLKTRACTAPCPYGKYSMTPGLQSASSCLDCPAYYRGPQGRRGNNPFYDTDGGHPCDRYRDGKNVPMGRNAYEAANLATFLSAPRTAHEEINDNVTP